MRVIFKYKLEDSGSIQTFPVSRDCKVLTVQMQNGYPTVWIEMDEAKINTRIKFRIRVTGEEFEDDNSIYIGTFQKDWFVGHVYQLK